MTFLCWALRRWVFEAYCREYPTRNLELGIPDVGHSRRWVFQMLGIPYENPLCVLARKIDTLKQKSKFGHLMLLILVFLICGLTITNKL